MQRLPASEQRFSVLMHSTVILYPEERISQHSASSPSSFTLPFSFPCGVLNVLGDTDIYKAGYTWLLFLALEIVIHFCIKHYPYLLLTLPFIFWLRDGVVNGVGQFIALVWPGWWLGWSARQLSLGLLIQNRLQQGWGQFHCSQALRSGSPILT